MGLGDVRDVLAGVLRDVEIIGTSPAVMRELLEDLQRAEASLANKLRAEATKHGALDARFTGAQALMVQQQVTQTIAYVQQRLQGHTAAQAGAAIDAGLKRTATTMEGLEKRFTGIVTPLRLRQAHEFSRAKAQARGMWAREFPTSVDRYGTKMLGEFEEIIRAGMIAGSSMDDIIAAITGHGGPTGKVSMAAKITPHGVLRVRESDIPEGLFVRHKYWAERLVRTEMLKAYNGARQAGLEVTELDHPGLKRKILATLDKRTAKDSIAVHGQIRGIKEHFVDGAGRSYLYPPARPNDRETVIPWKTDWEDSSENMSEWEKVCIGEGDAATEAKLEATMRAIAGGHVGPKTRKPKAVKPPMEQPKTKTWQERVEEDLRGRLKWGAFTGLRLDTAQAGYTQPPAQPGGLWRAFAVMRANVQNIGGFATEEAAKDALTAHWNVRCAQAAKSIERWKLSDYEAAAAAGDGARMRRQVRGLLYEQGVLPRDALFSDKADVLDVSPERKMPDARAYHHWDGRVELRRDVFDEAKGGPPTALTGEAKEMLIRKRFAGHLGTMIHEELHGSTNFESAGFYAKYGAAVEEVTVEMAARKIVAKALKMPPEWYGGAYQNAINEIVDIVQQEVAKVNKGLHRGVKDREAVADAGINMRGRKTSALPVYSPDGIVDQFMLNLKVPGKARKAIRQRILNEVTAPR